MKFALLFLFIPILSFSFCKSFAQKNGLDGCDIIWHSQSKNSSESMPCGGGDIGLNVWVENGELLFYMAQSGTFDENNTMLKQGRIRITTTPRLPDDGDFKQQLHPKDGYISLKTKDVTFLIWVDVFKPVIHVEMNADKGIGVKASYETWRYQDHVIANAKELRENSYKVRQPFDVTTYRDSVQFVKNTVVFYHRNRNDVRNIFDYTVDMEKMNPVKDSLFNSIINNTSGGMMIASGMKPAGVDSGVYAGTPFHAYSLQTKKPVRHQSITIALNTEQTKDISTWMDNLTATIDDSAKDKKAFANTKSWWHQYWDRSYIFIHDADSVMSVNYQLFRYMLGCNAQSKYPTKFNGGLFTFDPVYVDSSFPFSPDYRSWGGGTFTAQNQRLVYYGMLKSGDYDVMKPQFDFYLRLQQTAELRSKQYYHHKGAFFTEQLENFGLPNVFEYGLKRPENYDPGLEYNAWLEYSWETVFEFCNMMLETERYNHSNISVYLPFIKSCLAFYDEHYQLLAKQRGIKAFDSVGHYIFFPTSAAETYKMTYNSTTVICGLQSVLTRLLRLPSSYLNTADKQTFATMLSRIPPLPLRIINHHKTLAPAETWERVQNVESPQLYPVFPWGIYGIGKPDIDVARNTFQYDEQVLSNKSYKGWRQENIFAARLGFTDEAYDLTRKKLTAGNHRFPAFWGPGYDWTPDHNWGGTAMIGLQEMLLQADDEKIYLFPAWPKDKDVSFKLHAPQETIVEAELTSGKLKYLKVTPAERKKDVFLMIN